MALTLDIFGLEGPLCTVKLDTTAPLLYLNLDVEAKTGIPRTHQRFFLGSIELRNQTIFSAHTQESSELELLLVRRTLSREEEIYLAKLAELAERWDEMWDHVRNACEFPDEILGEERHLLNTAVENVVATRRAAWRMLHSIAHKETKAGNRTSANHAATYCDKVKAEMLGVCDDVLNLIDNHVLCNVNHGESKIFYHTMKARHHKYVAEISDASEKAEATENVRLAYEEAWQIGRSELEAIHPVFLGLALSYGTLLFEELGKRDEACSLLKTTIQEAMPKMDTAENDASCNLIVGLLRDALTLWESDAS